MLGRTPVESRSSGVLETGLADLRKLTSVSLNEILNELTAVRFFASEHEMLDKSHSFSLGRYLRCHASAFCHTWL